MIKGCSKRVIVMKETGHSMIEQAFFILKPGADRGGGVREGELIKHVNGILESSERENRFSGLNMNVLMQEKKKKNAGQFILGFILGGVIMLIVLTVL